MFLVGLMFLYFSPSPPAPSFFYFRMKMRRHRVFLLCTVGLCVISFLHYYKALHYVSLLRELSAPYPNIKSFIMVSGFFWRENGLASTPLSPASPEEAPPLPGRQFDSKSRDMGKETGNDIIDDKLAPPHPWEKPKESERGNSLNVVKWINYVHCWAFVYQKLTILL